MAAQSASSLQLPSSLFPRLLLPVLLLFLLGFEPTVLGIARTTSGDVVGTFESPHPGSKFEHLTVNKQKPTLYVGAVNYLYSLYGDLSLWQEVKTGPQKDNPDCPPPMVQFTECVHTKKDMDSYNKALVVDYKNQRLIACSSLFHGFCEKRNLDDISQRDTPSYQPVVANNKNSSTVAYIAPGPPKEPGQVQPDVLYVSVSWTRVGQSIWRERVPAFASRNLTDFNLAIRNQFRQTVIKIEVQQRESFPVSYIYGFGSEGFSYMITIQKRSAQSEEYISKIFRVCQRDENFYSYVEVELKCSKGATNYNLVQAAYLGRPGKNLARQLKIPTTEDVLFTVFSKGHDSSQNPTAESALCMYPMRKVRRIFTENIQKCFSGIGNTGPDHIAKPVQCLKNTQVTLNDDYCGESDLNQPIGGSDPIASEAALVFPNNTNVSAIAVSITEEYTVAFVGTTHGDIIKISLESETKANIYETVVVHPGKAIQKDLTFDENQDHLYVLTENRNNKTKKHTRYNKKTRKCWGHSTVTTSLTWLRDGSQATDGKP